MNSALCLTLQVVCVFLCMFLLQFLHCVVDRILCEYALCSFLNACVILEEVCFCMIHVVLDACAYVRVCRRIVFLTMRVLLANAVQMYMYGE